MKRFQCLFFLFSVLGFSSYAQSNWWNDAVFYEVFVRSFKDSNGDGNGDIQGLISKLDYLNDGDSSTHQDLGVTALWLMPIQQSPSYHGYDVTDYRTVEQDYGTNADFKLLMSEAHKRGIRVIIDLVMNHTSSQHPWFLESMNISNDKRSWYTYTSPKPAYNGPWGQNVWHLRNGYYNYGIFWSEMPDLNYTTPDVKTEMFDMARFWLEDMDVDGFRLDAIKYIFETNSTTSGSQVLEDTPETIQFWKDFRNYYKSIEDSAMAVGEAWTNTAKVAPYVSNGGLDFCFEFDLAEAIIAAANSGSNVNLLSKMNTVLSSYPSNQFATFLTNHDMNRVMNRFGGNVSKAKLGADLLLTLPGVPFLYYGEEIGMTGVKPDENIRTPMQWNAFAQSGFSTTTPWRPVNADFATKNVATQQADTNSLWNEYRKLIAIRNDQAALRKGNWTYVSNNNSAAIFSFMRQYGDERILVVANTSANAISNVELSMLSSGMLAGNYSLLELQGYSDQMVAVNASGDFTVSIGMLSPYSIRIYKWFNSSSTVYTSVTFNVDMNALISFDEFNPITESVEIVAEFNGFGTSISTLTDVDQDGVYEIKINNLPIGDKIHYKYKIRGANSLREEYAASTFMRQYLTLEKPGATNDVFEPTLLMSTEERKIADWYIFPNPSYTGEVYLEFTKEKTVSVDYTIQNSIGTELISLQNRSVFSTTTIDLKELPAGVYILTINCEGVKTQKKIVLK